MRNRLFLCWLLFFSLPVGAKEVLYWFQYDMRPFYIQDGPFAGRGLTEPADQMIRDGMPQYEHRILWGNLTRLMQLLSSGEKVVCSNLLRNAEREAALTISSHDRMILLVQELVVPRSRLPALAPYRKANGSVDLAHILRDAKLNGILPAGRSYGAILDPLLSRYRGNGKLESRHAQGNSIGGILPMLSAGRGDFTIAYPAELIYELRHRQWLAAGGREETTAMNLPLESLGFVTVPIAGMPEFVNGYVMGPKTAWGAKVIAEIDAVVARWRFHPDFVRSTLAWSEGDARRRLEKLYRQAAVAEKKKGTSQEVP